MSELLAPAGSFEALVAAISNGADAIYLGMKQFGARAYASNFDTDHLKSAIEYAHLRNVKIYVTMNTIVFEDELEAMKQMIDALYTARVDGVIIQDLAVFEYVVQTYPDLEAHCSTQMGIDDAEGTLLFKELGAKRVVLSREVPISKVKEIKKIVKLPLEIFIHGALCVSYSGNCLMSGLIGFRSGNRGRCVGSCRKPYTLIDETNAITYTSCYLLSMKDLNTIDQVDQYKDIDSLKIEGRMKEPAYVANVVSAYRKALDGTITKTEKDNLTKTFHRTFTKGYLFGEDKKNITNITRPNNFGYPIGTIASKSELGYKIHLEDVLNQNDIIRIDHNGEDVNLTVVKMYDAKKNYINSSSTSCYIQIKEDLSIGDIVYKTKDVKFYETIQKSYPKEYKRFPIHLIVSAFEKQPLIIHATVEHTQITYESKELLELARTNATTDETFKTQFNRLMDTVYALDSLEFYHDEVYIPAKLINEARRNIVEQLNEKRLFRQENRLPKKVLPKLHFAKKNPTLAVYATTQEQYEAAKECGIELIYTEKNTIRRNATQYPPKTGPLLIGGYGGLYSYRSSNEITTDFSLNVVNSEAVYKLHALGVHRVTLSHEMNKTQILQLIENYKKQNDGLPNLELIVYGHTHLLFTKYCPLKKYNLCNSCKKNQYYLKDEYEKFPVISHTDCTTTLLNGKILNLIDDINTIEDISVFRLQFTIESKEETKEIIEMFKDRLAHKTTNKLFSKETNTRGHFNKEIL